VTDPIQEPHDDERRLAIMRVRARRSLANHAVTYVVVNAFLVLVWWQTRPTGDFGWLAGSDGDFWPIWIIGGWGIGLALHAWKVLGARPITEADIERELRRGR